ncbi:hypothetical protein B0H11DRAFT_1908480 [Mycena galericulata]|nr:hypothetical protein B0H11DRAFT_1908480 [Mycena galericulata]
MCAGGRIWTGPETFAWGWLAEGPTSIKTGRMVQLGNGRRRARLDCGLRQELRPEDTCRRSLKRLRTFSKNPEVKIFGVSCSHQRDTIFVCWKPLPTFLKPPAASECFIFKTLLSAATDPLMTGYWALPTFGVKATGATEYYLTSVMRYRSYPFLAMYSAKTFFRMQTPPDVNVSCGLKLGSGPVKA